ncbi:hypothetical protein NDU88_003120 [Pleurodeles waltl]|uniref:Uncharacterized protein n=1 Tax=Pleurodeles waltl TaxID=8319 RepID=A0AAV7QC23_PLEWA|nr:hypothetical protein NDU88_003120 [Pleurodeles waltl]
MSDLIGEACQSPSVRLRCGRRGEGRAHLSLEASVGVERAYIPGDSSGKGGRRAQSCCRPRRRFLNEPAARASRAHLFHSGALPGRAPAPPPPWPETPRAAVTSSTSRQSAARSVKSDSSHTHPSAAAGPSVSGGRLIFPEDG